MHDFVAVNGNTGAYFAEESVFMLCRARWWMQQPREVLTVIRSALFKQENVHLLCHFHSLRHRMGAIFDNMLAVPTTAPIVLVNKHDVSAFEEVEGA